MAIPEYLLVAAIFLVLCMAVEKYLHNTISTESLEEFVFLALIWPLCIIGLFFVGSALFGLYVINISGRSIHKGLDLSICISRRICDPRRKSKSENKEST